MKCIRRVDVENRLVYVLEPGCGISTAHLVSCERRTTRIHVHEVEPREVVRVHRANGVDARDDLLVELNQESVRTLSVTPGLGARVQVGTPAVDRIGRRLDGHHLRVVHHVDLGVWCVSQDGAVGGVQRARKRVVDQADRRVVRITSDITVRENARHREVLELDIVPTDSNGHDLSSVVQDLHLCGLVVLSASEDIICRRARTRCEVG